MEAGRTEGGGLPLDEENIYFLDCTLRQDARENLEEKVSRRQKRKAHGRNIAKVEREKEVSGQKDKDRKRE